MRFFNTDTEQTKPIFTENKMTFLYFTIYLILISWLAWFFDKPSAYSTLIYSSGGFVDDFQVGDTIYNPEDETQATVISIDDSCTLTIGEFKRVSCLIGQAGIGAEEAIQNLKNVMDKACEDKTP